ncbi:hypothetical protein T35B1_14684 [Salinisphaera shabanensis T35B1]
MKLLPNLDVDPHAIEIPDGVVLDEQQYYIQKVGFFLAHSLTWYKQLDLAIEFLSNFDYSKNIGATRADHLIYNLENYLIRVNSAYDRVLQLVNAVFHLCISEENVGHAVVVSNYKVQHRPEIVSKIKAVKKFLADYAQARHTLIHKHSWLDAKMRRLELFYMHDLDALSDDKEWKKRLRYVRSQYLRDFISEKKDEFNQLNEALAVKVSDLFAELGGEYQRQVRALGRVVEL